MVWLTSRTPPSDSTIPIGRTPASSGSTDVLQSTPLRLERLHSEPSDVHATKARVRPDSPPFPTTAATAFSNPLGMATLVQRHRSGGAIRNPVPSPSTRSSESGSASLGGDATDASAPGIDFRSREIPLADFWEGSVTANGSSSVAVIPASTGS